METVAQLEAKLVNVRAAIEAVMLGQEYTFDTGMTTQKVKRADLDNLQALENNYESKLSVAELKADNCQITRGQSW